MSNTSGIKGTDRGIIYMVVPLFFMPYITSVKSDSQNVFGQKRCYSQNVLGKMAKNGGESQNVWGLNVFCISNG